MHHPANVPGVAKNRKITITVDGVQTASGFEIPATGLTPLDVERLLRSFTPPSRFVTVREDDDDETEEDKKQEKQDGHEEEEKNEDEEEVVVITDPATDGQSPACHSHTRRRGWPHRILHWFAGMLFHERPKKDGDVESGQTPTTSAAGDGDGDIFSDEEVESDAGSGSGCRTSDPEEQNPRGAAAEEGGVETAREIAEVPADDDQRVNAILVDGIDPPAFGKVDEAEAEAEDVVPFNDVAFNDVALCEHACPGRFFLTDESAEPFYNRASEKARRIELFLTVSALPFGKQWGTILPDLGIPVPMEGAVEEEDEAEADAEDVVPFNDAVFCEHATPGRFFLTDESDRLRQALASCPTVGWVVFFHCGAEEDRKTRHVTVPHELIDCLVAMLTDDATGIVGLPDVSLIRVHNDCPSLQRALKDHLSEVDCVEKVEDAWFRLRRHAARDADDVTGCDRFVLHEVRSQHLWAAVTKKKLCLSKKPCTDVTLLHETVANGRCNLLRQFDANSMNNDYCPAALASLRFLPLDGYVPVLTDAVGFCLRHLLVGPGGKVYSALSSSSLQAPCKQARDEALEKAGEAKIRMLDALQGIRDHQHRSFFDDDIIPLCTK